MPRSCTICCHPLRDTIDAAIRTGTAHSAIAQLHGVTRDSVRRHAQSHLADVATVKRTARADAPMNRPRAQGQNIPPDALGTTQATFLAAFVRDCNESAALRVAHIDRSTVRYWEEHSDDFSRRYHEAHRQVDDAIDGEIARRALYGVAEPVVSAGKVMTNGDGSIMTVQKYSDKMLELLAKAHHAKYREKQQVDVTSNGQTVGQGVTLDQLTLLMQRTPNDLTRWRNEQHYDDDDLGPS